MQSNACAPGATQRIYNDCFASDTCPEATPGATDFSCYSCIFANSSQSSSQWGPVVSTPQNIAYINVGGCITLLEPCNTECAAAFEDEIGCEEAACGASYGNDTGNQYNDCSEAADLCDPGGCFLYFNATSCESDLTGSSHPASVCVANLANFEANFLTVAGVFCGG